MVMANLWTVLLALDFKDCPFLDLTTHGMQPMVSNDGETVITFNGEIYNYIELREELLGLGHTFRSTGDTEVLLNAYRQWGEDCLSKLNGMWAFLIYDRRKKSVFGSRDRFGIKPLYYFRSKDQLIIASEIKAIAASGYYSPAPNWSIAANYLLNDQLSIPTNNRETFYNQVCEVPAGTAFTIDLQGRMRDVVLFGRLTPALKTVGEIRRSILLSSWRIPSVLDLEAMFQSEFACPGDWILQQ